MTRALGLVATGIVLLSGCRGAPPDELTRLVDSLMPPVERAVGLKFTHRPYAAVRSKQQVRSYIVAKLEQEYPSEKARGIQVAYRLLGLLPDSLDLRPLLLDLLTEQIAGYYEPDSSALFMVAGDDPQQLRLVLAHEMVHALQHQHTPLEAIMRLKGDDDRVTAAQAIFEGQATLAGLQVAVPKQNIIAMPEFWETFREQIKTQQSTMAVFRKAPRVIREELIFPYLAGADFMRWWAGSEHRDTVPFGRFLPQSTEQILHPSRYGLGDAPLSIVLHPVQGEDHALYEDVLGEFEMRVLAAELTGTPEVSTALAIGWGGDRFRVYQSPEGPALVWYTAWDDSVSADRFRSGTAGALGRKRRLGYRLELSTQPISGHPGIRVVLAPARWARWKSLPTAEVVPDSLANGGGGSGQR